MDAYNPLSLEEIIAEIQAESATRSNPLQPVVPTNTAPQAVQPGTESWKQAEQPFYQTPQQAMPATQPTAMHFPEFEELIKPAQPMPPAVFAEPSPYPTADLTIPEQPGSLAQAEPFFEPQPFVPAQNDSPQFEPLAFDDLSFSFLPAEPAPYEEAEEAEQPKKAKRFTKLFANIAFYALCIALLGGSILFSVSKDPRKNYFGYRTYSVLTESMTPKADGSSPPGGFREGDMIVVKMVDDPQTIKIGDIITFNPSIRDDENTMYLTHRVVEIKDELGGKAGLFFVTRGDDNNTDDLPISSDMVIGKKVFHIPRIGTWLQKVREHFVLAMVTVVCFFAFLFMLKWYFSIPKQKPQKPPQMVLGV